ncbi:MAG: hypothetical protein WC657_06595 [Candidatus Paceibacterota bacterium]|jgi:hypothetical protein
MKEESLGSMFEKVMRQVQKDHSPPDGAPIIKTDIELFFKDSSYLSKDERQGYRVRKVEWFDNFRFKRYGLSWKTGEWILVDEEYPEDTFLEVKNEKI